MLSGWYISKWCSLNLFLISNDFILTISVGVGESSSFPFLAGSVSLLRESKVRQNVQHLGREGDE